MIPSYTKTAAAAAFFSDFFGGVALFASLHRHPLRVTHTSTRPGKICSTFPNPAPGTRQLQQLVFAQPSRKSSRDVKIRKLTLSPRVQLARKKKNEGNFLRHGGKLGKLCKVTHRASFSFWVGKKFQFRHRVEGSKNSSLKFRKIWKSFKLWLTEEEEILVWCKRRVSANRAKI